MIIQNNRKYRTREGLEVVLDRKRSKQWVHCVTGRALKPGERLEHCTWTVHGSFIEGREHPYDLVEVSRDA